MQATGLVNCLACKKATFVLVYKLMIYFLLICIHTMAPDSRVVALDTPPHCRGFVSSVVARRIKDFLKR